MLCCQRLKTVLNGDHISSHNPKSHGTHKESWLCFPGESLEIWASPLRPTQVEENRTGIHNRSFSSTVLWAKKIRPHFNPKRFCRCHIRPQPPPPPTALLKLKTHRYTEGSWWAPQSHPHRRSQMAEWALSQCRPTAEPSPSGPTCCWSPFACLARCYGTCWGAGPANASDKGRPEGGCCFLQ